MPRRIPGEQPMPEEAVVEKGKKAPDKKEFKWGGLEKRVLLLRDFYNAVTSIRADLSVEETSIDLDRIFKKVFDQMSMGTQKKFHRHNKEQLQLDELERTTKNPLDHDDLESLPDEEYMALHEQYEANPKLRKIERLQTKLIEDLGDLDLFFLLELEKKIEVLKHKKAQVEELQTSPEKLSKWVPLDKIKTVFFEAFSVSVVVDGEWYKNNRLDNSVGVHFRGTVVNLIKEKESGDRRVAEEDTIRHENIHNFLDSPFHSFGDSGRALRSWERRVEIYFRLLDAKASPVILKNQQRLLSVFDVKGIIDDEHEEILAAMENAENAGFQKSYGFFGEDNKNIPSLSTAQARVIGQVEIFRAEAEKHNDLFLRENLKRVADNLEDGFVRVAQEMKKVFEIGSRLGAEAGEFVHFVFVLLKPSQFGLAEGLLRQRYGEEKVERAKQTVVFIENFRFDQDSLKELSKILSQDSKQIDGSDFIFLARKIHFDFEKNYPTEHFGFTGVEDIRNVRRLLKQIIELAKVKGWQTSDISSVEESLSLRYFSSTLDSFFKESANSLSVGWDNLTPEELADLKSAVENQVEYLSEDLPVQLGREEITPQDIYDSLYWQAVVLVGMEEKICPKIEEIFSGE